MENLVWTKQKPTEEGWYWTRSGMGAIHIYFVRKYANRFCIGDWFISDHIEYKSEWEWAGPIPTPKEIK